MTQSAHYKRAQILVDQRRPKDAEREVLKHLAEAPEDAWGYSLLATALNMQQRRDEALESAKKSVALQPSESWMHYVLGDVYYTARRFKDARAAVDEAIRLEPDVARYWGLKANVESADENWKGMLAAAETGLEHDASHQHCKNLRALALAKLGNKAAASALFSENLSDNPENALTFAYQGWTHLHHGAPNDAISSFSESLRLQPNLDWARVGMMAALRDRHWLFVAHRTVNRPWALPASLVGVIAGAGFMTLGLIMVKSNPMFIPLAVIGVVGFLAAGACYALVCSNIDKMDDEQLKLMMLFDDHGQYLLTEDERQKAWRNAVLVPICFPICAGLVFFNAKKHDSDSGFIALMFGLTAISYAALALKFYLGRMRHR